jgi:ribonuclease BN (tRNA processing enzyme)
MRLTVLGRSPARPNPGEACAGYLIEGGGTKVLVDIGPGIAANLLLRAQPEELGAVLVSHLHTDHFLDLVTLRYSYPWKEMAERKLRVILPPGSGRQMADMARGAGYPTFWDKSFVLEEHDGIAPIQVGGLRFEPYQTVHFVPTWGFQITAAGHGEDPSRVLAYSADAGPCDAVPAIARRADLFLCEATLRSIEEDASPPEERGHLLPSEAGAYAREAGAKRLLLTHLPVEDDGEWSRREASLTFGGPVEIAEPMGTYEV